MCSNYLCLRVRSNILLHSSRKSVNGEDRSWWQSFFRWGWTQLDLNSWSLQQGPRDLQVKNEVGLATWGRGQFSGGAAKRPGQVNKTTLSSVWFVTADSEVLGLLCEAIDGSFIKSLMICIDLELRALKQNFLHLSFYELLGSISVLSTIQPLH